MLAQLRQFWSNLSSTAKIIYAAVVAVSLAAIGGVGYWSSQPQYAVLFAKLEPENAASMVQKLKQDGTKFKLINNGTTILVPEEQAPTTRMDMVAAQLTQGSGTGYSLFDKMSLGATPFVQNINLVRALQGELERTFQALEPVASAKVLINLSESTPFAREEKPVTASVLITSKPGKTVSREMVKTIVHLTAGSVKGLSPDNVEVADAERGLLSEKHDSRSNLASNDQLAYQRETESHLEENAKAIIEKLTGHGSAVVRVTAEMSFRHVTEVSEHFDPEGKVPVRELSTKSETSAPAGARGVTGAVSNMAPPPAPNGSVPVVVPVSKDETSTNEYAVSHVNRSKEEQEGVIDRLTVAVIMIPPKGAGEGFEETFGLTPDDISDLVKQSVGFKNDRGDQIKVSIGKGTPEAPAEAEVTVDKVVAEVPLILGYDYPTVIRWTSLGLAGLLAFAMLLKAVRRRPKTKPAPLSPAFASANAGSQPLPHELTDLHAVAATIKAWLEEPAVIPFDSKSPSGTPQAKPA